VVTKDKKLNKSIKSTAKKAGLVNGIKKVFNSKFFTVFRLIGGYLKGSWLELKQVRWPDRKSTWGMTGAVILFTAVFIILIISLDAGFTKLFELILK
jgi:preprotein translocase SecE subunit